MKHAFTPTAYDVGLYWMPLLHVQVASLKMIYLSLLHRHVNSDGYLN
jgi:hypothetical protein